MSPDQLEGLYLLCGARQEAIDAYERLMANHNCAVLRLFLDFHPDDIRSSVEALRDVRAVWRESYAACILVTHSPVALDMMRSTPDRVLVIEDGEVEPVPLTELHNPEWLANFDLGGLYGDEFGKRRE